MVCDPLPESAVPKRILLGPGPSESHSRVLRAMSGPMIGYLDPYFLQVMDEVSDLLRRLFNTEDELAMVLPGTGSAGMEAGLSSLLEPGDTVVLCVCGFFGRRMVEMAERAGANVVLLESEWGVPFPAEMLEAELKKHENVKLVATVHAETSTGVLQPLEDISRLAKDHDSLLMVDAVTSLGGTEVKVDEIGIDYCYSGTQKCLAAPPGLSPVVVSQRAIETVTSRNTKAASWYLDLALISNWWGKNHVYHHTAPVSNIIGLREGLRIILEEGMDHRIARHRRNSAALRAGLKALGLRLVVSSEHQLDQITPVYIPEGVEDQSVRAALLRDHHIEIGRGLGDFAGKVWRIGLMGESSRAEYVLTLLSAFESILPDAGFEVALGSGVGAASRSLAAS